MADEVERLVVGIEGDYSKLLNDVKSGTQKATKELDKLSDGPKAAQGEVAKLTDLIGKQLIAAATGFIAIFSANQAFEFFKNLTSAAISANSQFETFTTQFTTLLGSAEAAKSRIDALAEFGQKTPFELPEVVEASRTLQTFGGSVLAQGENLRRVGDSAAAVNASFKEVAFWTGRMYNAIQAGRPFGEASARLQELGIMSGDVRTKLEQMQKTGASGEEVWAAYTEMIDTKFAGAMDKLSLTLQGIISNLADFQGMLLRVGGEQLFEGVRKDVGAFYDIINRPEAKEALIGLAKAFGAVADAVRGIVDTAFLDVFKGIDLEEVKQLGDSITDFSTALAKLTVGENADDVNDTISALTVTIDSFTIQLNKFNETASNLREWGVTFTEASDALERIANPAKNAVATFGDLNDVLKKLTGNKTDISDVSRQMVEDSKSEQDRANELAAAYADYGRTLAAAADAQKQMENDKAAEELKRTAEEAEKAAAAMERLKETIDSAAGDMIDLQAQLVDKRQELEADHGEKIAEIAANYEDKKAEIIQGKEEDLAKLETEGVKKRQQIAKDTADDLAKLETETAKKQEEINEKAAESLAEVAAKANEDIAKERETQQKKEERDTENFQNDMRRLREGYLDDLTDAVTNRDARAIVDLRRRYSREKNEAEQKQKLDRDRGREDSQSKVTEIRQTEQKRTQEIKRQQAKQLQDLADSEAEKRAQIFNSQAEQLASLAENEAEKRAEIEASFQEQMAKNDENFAVATAKENEQYAKRKEALDEAMAKRLEDVAKGLSDEKDMTEEGARAILEALNKTFGIGGDIDALMDEFMARRRQKLVIQIGVEESIAHPKPSSSSHNTPTHPGAGSGQAQGTHPGQIPGFAKGGTLIATKPTVAIFGEAGPEIAQFTPLSKMGQGGGKPMQLEVTMKGSAPPGIRSGDREELAGVMVEALIKAGIKSRAR